MYIKEQAVIYGAVFDESWNVCHIGVDKKDELKRLYTSKYVQSDVGDVFRQAKSNLDNGKKVLFAGTPCQIAGLKSYLKKDYLNLLTVDFICHGVPSPLVWQRYIDELKRNLDTEITDISFRDKKDGWKSYNFKLITANGNIFYEKHGDNIYMHGFLKDLYLRPSCYDCKFKTLQRTSDITLADFWGIEKIISDINIDGGVSLCWASSEKGKQVLANVLMETDYYKVNLNEAIKHNSSAIKSVKMHKNRDKFFEKLNNSDADIISLIEKYYDNRSLRKRLSSKLRAKLKSLFR